MNKISGYKKTDQQLRLWDKDLPSPAYARNCIGDLGEELTAAFVGGRIHKTDSRCEFCPDVSVDSPIGKIYYESKMVGCNAQFFVYSGRITHELKFSENNMLIYCIWHHKFKTCTDGVMTATTYEDLKAGVVSRLQYCVLIPYEFLLHYHIAQRSNQPLNSGYGGTDRERYGAGVRIPLGELKQSPYSQVFEWESHDGKEEI